VLCPDCAGAGMVVDKRWPGSRRALPMVPCLGCNGLGHAHCCDGAIGSGAEICNRGEDDGSPSSEPTAAEE